MPHCLIPSQKHEVTVHSAIKHGVKGLSGRFFFLWTTLCSYKLRVTLVEFESPFLPQPSLVGGHMD